MPHMVDWILKSGRGLGSSHSRCICRIMFRYCFIDVNLRERARKAV